MAIQSKTQLRNSGIVISIFIIIFFIFIPYLLHNTINFFALIPSLLIFLLSIFNPYKLRKPINFWLKIGAFLGKLNSTLILFIFFYFILFPAALIRYVIKFLSKREKVHEKTYARMISKEKKSDFSDQY